LNRKGIPTWPIAGFSLGACHHRDLGPRPGGYQSEVLFSHKHWQVELVAWDDGVLGCVAQVSSPGESFSIWTFQDEAVQIQFYSTPGTLAKATPPTCRCRSTSARPGT
jgi:hypothetical protein